MTKDKCSIAFLAGRNLGGRSLVRCLAFLALVAFMAGCRTNQVVDFTPKSAMICDQVRITGTFHNNPDDLDGVWFNGVRAKASFRHFPAPNGPLEILAVVPEKASNGPIRVKIAGEDAALFGVKRVDFTFRDPFSVTGSPPVPAINSFSASPETIKPGQTSTLSWQVSPAVKQLTLDDADVTGTNSLTVSPAVTTVYYLVAKNESCLQQNQAVAVTVTPSPENTAPGSAVSPAVDPNAVTGAGPAQTNEPSPGAATATATVAAPVDHQPAVPAPAPASIAGAPVKAQAAAGSSARKAAAVAPIARKDGAFVDIKSRIGLASQTCGAKELQVSTNRPGEDQPGLAVFRQGGTTLAQYNFQSGIIGGAAFSPGGDQAVVVTADPNGFSASYVTEFERFATHYKFQFPVNVMDGRKTAANRWHVLFSPDDTIVMISTVPVAGPAKIAVQVHDLVKRKDLGTLVQASCAACDLQGEVVNGNTVQIKLDGAVVATFPLN